MDNNNEERLLERIELLEAEVARQKAELDYLRNTLRLPKPFISLQAPRPTQQQPTVQPVQQPAATSRNVENKIGNSMGVVASVLIFISLILFVTMVYSSLTDVIKVAIIFIFSFALLGLGTYAMHKSRNVFTMSLTGCGMGALFISIFVTHFYFEMTGSIALYIMVVAWALMVYCFFSKKSYAFHLIGQAGILIATIFGFSLVNSDGDFLLLFIVFVLMSSFYAVTCLKFNQAKFIPFIASDYLCILILFAEAHYIISETLLPVLAVFAAIYVLALCFEYVFIAETKHIVVDIALLAVYISALILGFALLETLDFDYDGGALFAVKVIYLCLVFCVELFRYAKNKTDERLHCLSTAIFFVALVFATENFHLLCNSAGYSLHVVVLIALAVLLKDRAILAAAFGFIIPIAGNVRNAPAFLIPMTIASLAGGYCVLALKKDLYHRYLKTLLYCITILSINDCSWECAKLIGLKFSSRSLVSFSVIAIINSIIGHTAFVKNWIADDKVTEKCVVHTIWLINAMLMPIGLLELQRNSYWFLEMICTIACFGVFATNIRNTYKRHGDKPLASAYIAFKLCVFTYFVLYSNELTGPYVSIGWLALAIIFIITGFRFKYRYLRLCGLFLTMFSVVKLIVFDISYSSPAGRSVSFLICGLLCFVISMLYRNIKDE